MIMFEINDSDWKKLMDRISFKDDVYDDGSGKYGVEAEPHVTILYGLHDDKFKFDDLKEMLPPVSTMTAILSAISHFECPEYDVLKFDVDAPKYHHVNKRIRDKFQYTTDYPEYHPHMTLAYLKKGCGCKYKHDALSVPLTPKQYKYGFADGRDEFFSI